MEKGKSVLLRLQRFMGTEKEGVLFPDLFQGKIPEKINKPNEHPGRFGSDLAWFCNISENDLRIALKNTAEAKMLSHGHNLTMAVTELKSMKVCDYAYDTDGNRLHGLCSIFVPKVFMVLSLRKQELLNKSLAA